MGERGGPWVGGKLPYGGVGIVGLRSKIVLSEGDDRKKRAKLPSPKVNVGKRRVKTTKDGQWFPAEAFFFGC